MRQCWWILILFKIGAALKLGWHDWFTHKIGNAAHSGDSEVEEVDNWRATQWNNELLEVSNGAPIQDGWSTDSNTTEVRFLRCCRRYFICSVLFPCSNLYAESFIIKPAEQSMDLLSLRGFWKNGTPRMAQLRLKRCRNNGIRRSFLMFHNTHRQNVTSSSKVV